MADLTLSFSRVLKILSAAFPAGKFEIHGTIIVVIGSHCSDARSISAKTELRHGSECSVPVAAPHHILTVRRQSFAPGCVAFFRRLYRNGLCNVQIEVSVVIVIDESHPNCHLLKLRIVQPWHRRGFGTKLRHSFLLVSR